MCRIEGTFALSKEEVRQKKKATRLQAQRREKLWASVALVSFDCGPQSIISGASGRESEIGSPKRQLD